MKPIARDELLDLGAYEALRERFLSRVLEAKKPRYVRLGTNMTGLFENRDTVLFQIQEMLRTERITQEKAILHELETYNELVPGNGELSLTLFIEYSERDERERMLMTLAGVEDKFALRVAGELVRVVPDPRATDPARTMAVQYLKFPLGDSALHELRFGPGPFAFVVNHSAYAAETPIEGGTLQSLRDDFA